MAFTWSLVNAPTSGGQDVADFVWDSGHAVLVAVGTSGLVYTTPTGATWTKQTAAAANGWRGVAYTPTLATLGRLVAVASSGTNRVMYSDDGGVTWTSASASAANGWQSVTWAVALGLFVAVASSGAADGSTATMVSPDGITWTTRPGINPRLPWQGVTWSPSLGLLVAIAGNTTTDMVMTSPDAIAWTRRTTPGTVQTAGRSSGSCVQWSANVGKFAFESKTSVTRSVTTSPDGLTWTEQTIPDNLQAVGGVQTVGADGFILFRQATVNRVNTSPDGVTWTQVDPGFYHNWNATGYAPLASPFVVAWGDGSSTQMLTGTPVAVVITIAPTTLPDASGGTAYSQQLTASGGTGPYTYTLFSGTLPTGLSLSSSGLITGTPLVVGTLLPTTLPAGVVDTFYSQAITVADVGAPFTFTVRATDANAATGDQAYTVTETNWANPSTFAAVCPSCLTCSSTGVLSGYPMKVAVTDITVVATDEANRTASRTYTLTATS